MKSRSGAVNSPPKVRRPREKSRRWPTTLRRPRRISKGPLGSKFERTGKARIGLDRAASFRAERPAVASRGGEALEHNRIAAPGRPAFDVGQPDALERIGEAAARERRVALNPRRTECAGDASIHGDAAGETLAAGAKERIGEGGLQIDPRPERQGTARADGQGPSDAHLC